MSSETSEYQCSCCNNPWSAATGKFFAQLCQECEVKTPEGKGLSRSNMDFSITPWENFYEFANGTWMKENPIPTGYSSWNTFLSLHVKSQENLLELLQGLESKEVKTPDEIKVASFYAAAMDESAIEQAGTTPMKPLLDLIDQTVEAYQGGDFKSYAKHLGEMNAYYGVSPFFNIGSSPDNTNSDHCICQVVQGGIGLPDRDYYFDEDKDSKRVAYKTHIAKMLALLDGTQDSLEKMPIAEAIYNEVEMKLAEKHMTKTENRDPEATYNKMSIADLSHICCDGSFDFAAYFEGCAGLVELGDINVRHTEALQRTAEIASTVNVETLRNYLRWTAIRSCAPYLSEDFVNENFDFYERVLTGTEEIKPRWKRAMAFTEAALGEALGQMFCAAYFDEECKERAVQIVENVRQALEERLKEVEWITSSVTRENALKKMKRFKVKIGFPDKWIDYTTLDISGDFLSMVFKSRAFHHFREVKEMNQPTNRDKWFMTPQTVNAYYHPSLNEIVFPAAILQPPFFNRDADDAVNYGAMGAVVGHEMTHGFDDKGRKFNADGNMLDWWTEEDATEYMKRVEVMVNQANDFQVHGQSVQGKLTCGENIADSGGILLAYRALKNVKGFDEMPHIDGFSPKQRFFLAWAQAWRQNITKERSLQLLTLDPHGPNEMRCNLPLSNIAAFHEAFEVPQGSAMYKEPDLRVDIW
jgi:putative endopeptidase